MRLEYVCNAANFQFEGELCGRMNGHGLQQGVNLSDEEAADFQGLDWSRFRSLRKTTDKWKMRMTWRHMPVSAVC